MVRKCRCRRALLPECVYDYLFDLVQCRSEISRFSTVLLDGLYSVGWSHVYYYCPQSHIQLNARQILVFDLNIAGAPSVQTPLRQVMSRSDSKQDFFTASNRSFPCVLPRNDSMDKKFPCISKCGDKLRMKISSCAESHISFDSSMPKKKRVFELLTFVIRGCFGCLAIVHCRRLNCITLEWNGGKVTFFIRMNAIDSFYETLFHKFTVRI